MNPTEPSPKLILLLPTYNDWECLPILLARVDQSLADQAGSLSGKPLVVATGPSHRPSNTVLGSLRGARVEAHRSSPFSSRGQIRLGDLAKALEIPQLPPLLLHE